MNDHIAHSSTSTVDPGGRPSGGGALPPEIADRLVDSVLRRSGTGVVLFDHELRYVMANDVAAVINGLPADEHLGRTLGEVLPEVATGLEPVLQKVLDTGEPQLDLDVSGSTPALPGERRWWRANVVRIDHPRGRDVGGPPYVAVVFVETTEQRRSHHRLRQLIDNLFTFVGLLDPDGTVREANATALEAGGLDIADVADRPFWEAYWWSHDASVQERVRRAIDLAARERRASRFDVVVRVAGGHLIPIDFQLAPIVEDDEVVALVPSGLDISSRVEDAEQLAALADLSNALNGAVDTAEVVEAILARSETFERASFVNLALVDRDARLLRIAMRDVPAHVEEAWATVPLEGFGPTPFHDAIATRAPVTVESASERERRYPDMVPHAAAVGVVGTAALPLRDRSGEVVAVLGLGWPEEFRPSAQVEARFELIMDLCAQAVARVRRTEAFAELVESLQQELLLGESHQDGLDVAVEYRPAVRSLGFGGDWYDTVPAQDGSTSFVVGDVAGHGVTAAAQMAQAKGILRGLCLSADLGDLPRHATAALAGGRPGFVATAVVATVDAGRGVLRWVNAGHPPPVLRPGDGGARFLEARPVGPLGMVRGPVRVSECRLTPGSLLVLYTDGLVERRRRSIDEGLGELLGAVEALPPGIDADGARDALLDSMVAGGSGDDDVAIIVVALTAR